MTSGHTSSSERMLAIPRLFTLERPVWTVDEVSRELGISISTAYRYFQSLIRFEYLDEVPGGGYRLGPAFIEFDRIIRATDPLSQVAGPILSALAASMEPGTVLLLSQMYRRKVMCVQQELVGTQEGAVSYERGRPMPLFQGATSKVILAHQPWRVQKREYELNADYLRQAGLGADWKAFSAGLRDIRKRGYCVSRSEVDAGRMGIAAAIFSGSDHVQHSLSAVVWESQVDRRREERLIMGVVTAAGRISEALTRLSGEAP